MTTLNVPDMHCENCVKRIRTALDNAKIDFTISLQNKTVSVEEKNVPLTTDELDDLGFTATRK